MAEEAARDLPEPETKPSGKALAPLPATGAQVSIRVVEIRRTFVDLAAAGTEEVDQAAAALKDDPVLAGALAVLARQLQGPVFRRLRPPDSASAALAARELLANPAVRPVLEPGRAQEAAGASVHVRPAARVRATDPGGRDRAVAAEDAVDVSGFVTDPAEAGLLIRAERPGPLSAEVYAACGAYSAGLLYAAVGEGRPPELPGEPAAAAPFAGFVCASVAADQPSGPAALEALAAHTAAAVRFYLSGAAWAVVAAWIAAAARGKPAPAALGESAGPVAPRERAEAPRLAAAWRPPAAQARLVELLERLAHARGAAPPGPDAVRFDGAPFAELQRLDAVGAYRAALVEGRESEELAAFLERAATRRMKVLHVLGLARAADVAAAAQGVKLRIVADKLGAARAVGDPEAILAGLARAERELVEAEFERRRLAWQAAAANRCPHVRFAVRVRRAPSAEEAARAFAELEKFLEAPRGEAAPAAEWLLCRSCGHRAICPHVRDRVRLEARGLPAGALRTRLQRYAVRVSSGDASAFFCRVCGESLGGADDDEAALAALGRFGALGGSLRARAWAIALEAAPALRFPAPTDERVFAAAAADVVYPLLQAASSAAAPGRARRPARPPRPGSAAEAPRSRDEVSVEAQIAALIYVYAYILDLLVASRGTGREVGFKGLRPGAKPAEAAECLLRHLAAAGRSLLAQVEDLSAERLKERFAEAFRQVRGAGGAAFRPPDPEEGLAVQLVELSAVYRYAAQAARIAGALSSAGTGPARARREFETLLGAGIPALIRKAQAAARDPVLAPLLARRAGAVIPGGALELVAKTAPANLFATLYRPPPDPAGRREWCTPAGASRAFAEGYRLFARYTREVSTEEARAAFREDLAQARACEATHLAAAARGAFHPEHDVPRVPVAVPARAPAAIGALYDAEGRPHDWSRRVTYVYQVPGAGEVEIAGGPAGAAAARAAGQLPPGAALADLRCATCGRRASQLADLDAAGVTAALRARTEARALFSYYEARCPRGDLHTWEEGRCARCGLSAAAAQAGAAGEFGGTAGAEARAYFEAHAAHFAAERRVARAPPAAFQPAPPAKPAAPDAAEEAARAWRADFSLVVRAAALAGTTPAALEALGATAGRDFADVLEGRDPPPAPNNPADPRIFAADAQVRLFLSEYSRLRHAARLARPGPEAAELLAAVPRDAWEALPRVLPELGEDYDRLAGAVRRVRSPADALAFAIQSLCGLVLKAAEPGPPEPAWAGGLGAAFAKKMAERIVQGQRLLSKPGSFAWELFETDEAPPDQVGDAGEDVLEEILTEEREEAPEDPFSGDHADYDVSEDNPNNEMA